MAKLKVTLVNPIQDSKALLPIDSIVDGIVIVSINCNSLNTLAPIDLI